jgi:Rab-GTPase-TBC domain
MSYLLLVLYYYFDTYDSFLCLSNLVVGNRMMRDLYTFDMAKVTSYTKIFEKLLEKQSPDLVRYLQSHCINTMTFSVDWFYTLYGRAFDINIVRVVWDMFLLFGSQFLVRAGVALMVILEDELMTEYMNEGFNFVRVRTGKLKISRILECALSKGTDPNSFTDDLEKLYNEFSPPVKRIPQ